MEHEEQTASKRVLVCGGRHYQDWRRVADALRHLHDSSPIGLIIHGCDPGPLHSPLGGLSWQGFRPVGSMPILDRTGQLPSDFATSA
jgi:hypothetical protein